MERVSTRGSTYRTKPKNVFQSIKRTLKYLSASKVKFAFCIFAIFLNVFVNLSGTYLIKVILDNVIKPISEGKLASIYSLYGFLGMIGCYTLSFLFYIIEIMLLVRISQDGLKRMRNELSNKLLNLPLTFYDKNTHGDIMSRFTNDIDMINEMYSSSFNEILISALSVTIIGVYLFVLNWIMALVAFVFIPIVLMTINFFSKRTRKEFHATQLKLGELEGYSEEILQGQRIVKTFNKEDDCLNEFKQINTEFNEHSFKSVYNSTLTIPIVNNINSINFVICCLVAGLLVFFNVNIPGAIVTTGVLASFINFIRQFTRPLNRITQQINVVLAALAGADRVFNLLDMKDEDDNDSAVYSLVEEDDKRYWTDGNVKIAVKGDVRLYGVDFSYVKNQPILHDISLYAKPGQKIAFVGSTGAGKTTITNLLTRFYDIDEGRITIDGIDLSKIDRKSMRKSMTLVLQDTHLFSGTIMDNIRFGNLNATDEECIEAGKISHADNFINKLPDGYNTVISGTNDTLSQGQRQLLSIARCAVSNPPILILDEATSSVDTRTEKYISMGMDELMKNKTTFVIAHRLSTVKNADAIMVLEHGQIIERGNHEELLEERGRYYSLCIGAAKLE